MAEAKNVNVVGEVPKQTEHVQELFHQFSFVAVCFHIHSVLSIHKHFEASGDFVRSDFTSELSRTICVHVISSLDDN